MDNGSTDGQKIIYMIIKIFPKIKVVRVKNIGYGFGIKYGLKFATGKIVSWTHADLQFDIKDVMKFLDKNYNDISII